MLDTHLSTDAKVYYLSTGTRGSWGTTADGITTAGTAPANLTELVNIRGDISVPYEKVIQEIMIKGKRHAAAKGTIRKTAIAFSMVFDNTDAAFLAIQKAYLTDTTIAMALLSEAKDVIGTEGIWADFEVTKFERGEKLDDLLMQDVEIQFGLSDVEPEYVKIVD